MLEYEPNRLAQLHRVSPVYRYPILNRKSNNSKNHLPACATNAGEGDEVSTPCCAGLSGMAGLFCLKEVEVKKNNLINSRRGDFIRPKRTAIEFAGAAMFVCALLLATGVALAQRNDPPDRIWYKEAPRWTWLQSNYYYDHTWIGDQNGDGCDELLICQEPLIRGDGFADAYNTVELYLGDPDQISQEPAFVFEARDSLESMGWKVAYLGVLTAEGAHDFAIRTSMYEPNQEFGDAIQYWEVNIYQGGEDRFDTEADYRIRLPWLSLVSTDRPFDINNDGFNDLAVRTWIGELYNGLPAGNGRSLLNVYFGGEDFDTTADFVIDDSTGRYEVHSGFDLNGDSFDDLITKSWDRLNNLVFYDFFMGSEEPRNEPILSIHEGRYEGSYIYRVNGFPDINSDGYDDWGIGLLHQDSESAESWICFGGDTLNDEPDVLISPLSGFAFFHGGSTNSDNTSDVIIQVEPEIRNSDLRILLGAKYLDEQTPIRCGGVPPNTQTQGAYADFNGDGCGDIAIAGQVTNNDAGPPRMAIFAGRPE